MHPSALPLTIIQVDCLRLTREESRAYSAAEFGSEKMKKIRYTNIRGDELAIALEGVDVVVSALNGRALESQVDIQDAAVDAGVKMFYPSECELHHVYQRLGEMAGYLHPVSFSDRRGYGCILLVYSLEPFTGFM